jgi:hypothetical protein
VKLTHNIYTTQKIDSGHIGFLGKSIVPCQDDIINHPWKWSNPSSKATPEGAGGSKVLKWISF